jgi:hypothetical protein
VSSPIKKVTHKRTGDTDEKILAATEKKFAETILQDCKKTPDRFPGRPYFDTGRLVNGLVLRLTGVRSRGRTGIIGRVVAPSDRLQNKHTHRGFIGKICEAWRLFSIGHSRGR